MCRVLLTGVLWIICANIFYCKHVDFVTRNREGFGLSRYSERRFSDFYPSDTSLDKDYNYYDDFKRPSRKYVYPESSIHYSYNTPYYHNNPFNQTRRKNYYEESNEDSVKIDLGTLQSDYGDIVNYNDNTNYHDNTNYNDNANYNDKNQYISTFYDYLKDVQHNQNKTHTTYLSPGQIFRKPIIKVKRNQTNSGLDSNLLNNIQKYTKYNKNNITSNENVNIKIHGLLSKYLTKLHKKKNLQALNANNQVTLTVKPQLAEEIDTAEDTSNIINHDNDYYDNIEDTLQIKSNDTKSKLLDNKFINIKNQSSIFKNKFLSLFTIIKFENDPCQSTETMDYYEGICYHATECTALNGTAMGTCANGYGVCCVFIGICGGSSSQNCTYFQSPNYPNYYPANGTIVPPPVIPPGNGTINPRLRYQLMKLLARQESTVNALSCIFEIEKASDDIRQLLIEFVDLELRGPTNGTCINERLVISGQNPNDIIPAICGYNSGQHIYVDVTEVEGPIQIAVLASAIERKRFRIRICQISTCSNPLNCLQYFTGLTGVITTFNYDQATSLSRSVPQYFNNLNYAVCIRKEKNYCSITYSVVYNGSSYPFQLLNVDELGQPTIPAGQAGAEIFSCPDDFIVINGIRLCGNRLNDGSINGDFTQSAPVTDTSNGPFILPVRTDGTVAGRGFKLSYSQNRCPNT